MSLLKLPLWIGLRYMRSREKQRFLSLLSWFSLLGMAIGVAALIIVLSVMNGFQGEVRNRLFDLMAHGQVQTSAKILSEQQQNTLFQQLAANQSIIASAPLVGGEVMLSQGVMLRAAVLQGVDVKAEQTISPIANRMREGRFENLADYPYGIILGHSLARAMRLQVGDKVLVSLPKLTITPFGIKPRVKQFTVLGTFEVGSELDSSHAYINITDAQRLYAIGDTVHAIRYLSQEVLQADKLAANLQIALGDEFQVSSWMDEKTQLFAAIRMEKRMTGLMLALVVLVAACNLVSLLSMMVAAKRNEIAVLRMMGLSQFSVVLVFLSQGLGLALFGILLGTALGLLVASYLSDVILYFEQHWQLYVFDPNVFYVSGLPSIIQLSDILWVVLLSVLLSVLFSVYPAYQASKIKPVEALQYQ